MAMGCLGPSNRQPEAAAHNKVQQGRGVDTGLATAPKSSPDDRGHIIAANRTESLTGSLSITLTTLKSKGSGSICPGSPSAGSPRIAASRPQDEDAGGGAEQQGQQTSTASSLGSGAARSATAGWAGPRRAASSRDVARARAMVVRHTASSRGVAGEAAAVAQSEGHLVFRTAEPFHAAPSLERPARPPVEEGPTMATGPATAAEEQPGTEEGPAMEEEQAAAEPGRQTAERVGGGLTLRHPSSGGWLGSGGRRRWLSAQRAGVGSRVAPVQQGGGDVRGAQRAELSQQRLLQPQAGVADHAGAGLARPLDGEAAPRSPPLLADAPAPHLPPAAAAAGGGGCRGGAGGGRASRR